MIGFVAVSVFEEYSVPYEGRRQWVSLAAVAASLHPLSTPATACAVPESYGIPSVGSARRFRLRATRYGGISAASLHPRL